MTEQSLWSKENFLFLVILIKWLLTGVIFPVIDMGSDMATAAIHYRADNPAWGTLTLVFVWLPGFVIAAAIAIRGLKKEVTARAVVNFSLFVLLFPFLYPFLQILL